MHDECNQLSQCVCVGVKNIKDIFKTQFILSGASLAAWGEGVF